MKPVVRKGSPPKCPGAALLALLLAAMTLAAFAADNPDGESSRESSSSRSSSSRSSSSSREESPRSSSSRRSAASEESEEATEPVTEPPEPVVVIRTVEVEAVTEDISRAVGTADGFVDVAAVSYMAEAGAALALVNAAREEAGLLPLDDDGYLTETALLRSLELSLAFGHERPDGTAWYTAAGDAASELIAQGYQTGAATAGAWLASPGHRAALLDEAYTRIGISGVLVNGEFYWALTLGV